jgi:hypothetical protein
MGTLRKDENIAKDTPDSVNKESKTVSMMDYLRKDLEFEEYVADIFKTQPQLFTIVNRTHDQSHEQNGAMVESEKEPDFKIRCALTNNAFFVVCKWRARLLSEDRLEWCYELFLRKCQRYYRRIPVFVVVGLGGKPTSPDRMFIIPLKEARWNELFPSVYMKHERPPDRKFFWRNGVLS